MLSRKTQLKTYTQLKQNKPLSQKRSKRAREKDFTPKTKAVVRERSENLCEWCHSKFITQFHHCQFRSDCGTNELSNCLGLDNDCHLLPHMDAEIRQKMVELAKRLAKGGVEHGCPHANDA